MTAQAAVYHRAAVSLLTWQFLERRVPRGSIQFVGYIAAAAGIALVTGAIGLIFAHARVDNVAMLYLLVVLPTAVRFGRGPAVFASLAAFLSYNWFFVSPLHTFSVADPVEWPALFVFLAVATVTSQLAATQRERAREAFQREQETRALYELGRLLATTGTLDDALQAVVEHLRRALRLDGCAILEPADPAHGGRVVVRAQAGVAPDDSEGATQWLASPTQLTGDASDNSGESPARGRRWVRIRAPRASSIAADGLGQMARPARGVTYAPLRAGVQTVGMLRLLSDGSPPVWTPQDERLLTAAGEQIGQAIERARLRQEATEAEVLRRTDQVRQAVLASLSHDLRTPLASIRASAENLHQPDLLLTDEERTVFAGAILQDVDYLHRLVENLLDLSRIEAGRLVPQRDWYPLDALVDDVLGRLERLTAQHPIAVDIPEDLPPLPLDYVLIGQTLSNLVENAVHYTPPGTTMTIGARMEGKNAVIHVADDGPGIPAQALPHIFEKFYRVSGGDRAAVPGTGLGLAIARGLVEAHGGRITAESPVPGHPRGTVFTILLPLDAPVPGLAPTKAAPTDRRAA